MGGDHHGHGHAKIRIPDYTIYKTETVPELMAVRRALASKGLTDPWLRNEVWKFDIKQKGNVQQIFRNTLGRGMLWGFVAAVITTGVGMAMDSMSGDEHGHGHKEDGHH